MFTDEWIDDSGFWRGKVGGERCNKLYMMYFVEEFGRFLRRGSMWILVEGVE